MEVVAWYVPYRDTGQNCGVAARLDTVRSKFSELAQSLEPQALGVNAGIGEHGQGAMELWLHLRRPLL